jgi:hypothetical protein
VHVSIVLNRDNAMMTHKLSFEEKPFDTFSEALRLMFKTSYQFIRLRT